LPTETEPSARKAALNFKESFNLMDGAEILYAEVAAAAQAK